jgi:hypothetical protein
VLTECDYETQIAINNFCRKNKNIKNNFIKFISADCCGPFAYLFNDFGDSFEVVDKDGEDPVEYNLSKITNDEKG